MHLDNVQVLDVSELEPPLPMHQITSALNALLSGEVLFVKHRRVPIPLFNVIEGQYQHHHVQINEDCVQLYFWRQADESATTLATALIQKSVFE